MQSEMRLKKDDNYWAIHNGEIHKITKRDDYIDDFFIQDTENRISTLKVQVGFLSSGLIIYFKCSSTPKDLKKL